MFLERFRQDGKVAVITGGARGIGFGIARVLAEAGASLVLTARSKDSLDKAVAGIESMGGRAVSVVGDVLRKIDNERAIDCALTEFGRVDILINNAGGTDGVKPFFELDQERFQNDFLFNVHSALQMTQLAAPHLMKHGDGSVVNISSRSAQLGSCGFTSYSVAKAALERLTQMMAKELAPRIRVNAISLGTVATDTFEQVLRLSPSMAETLLSNIPLGRLAEPEDVGMAALYFCSSRAYASGAVLRLDGGLDAPVR